MDADGVGEGICYIRISYEDQSGTYVDEFTGLLSGTPGCGQAHSISGFANNYPGVTIPKIIGFYGIHYVASTGKSVLNSLGFEYTTNVCPTA